MREGYCSCLVCLSVCLSVYPSVPAVAASATVETSKQRVSLRPFLDGYVWSFDKTFRSNVMVWKSQYANELELTVSRFRAVSGPMKHSSYVTEACTEQAVKSLGADRARSDSSYALHRQSRRREKGAEGHQRLSTGATGVRYRQRPARGSDALARA